MRTVETAPTGHNATTTDAPAPADEFIGLQALFVALCEHTHANGVPAPRALRPRMREAIAVGVVEHIKVGRRIAVRRSDAPLIASAIGLHASA